MTRPLLCLVTDRRRLARAAGRGEADAVSLLLSQIEGAVRGGVAMVQVREPDLEAGALAHLVRAARTIARGSATQIIVNDRIDVALAAAAHGVHLRENGVAADVVKRAWPGLTIGRSVHSRDAVTRGGGVDYWIAGTTFPTASKPHVECLGGEGLAAIVRAASGTPVLAIGGITETELPVIVRAGAQGAAAIGAFMPDDRATDVAAAVEKRVKTLRFAFDSASAVS